MRISTAFFQHDVHESDLPEVVEASSQQTMQTGPKILNRFDNVVRDLGRKSLGELKQALYMPLPTYQILRHVAIKCRNDDSTIETTVTSSPHCT